MNSEVVKYLISPVKKSQLRITKQRKSNNRIVSGLLVSEDESESFQVIAGIPLLLPLGYPSEWAHPLYEILLGDEAIGIVTRFFEDDPKNLTTNLSNYIKYKLGRDGIVEAFEKHGKIPLEQRYKSLITIPENEKSTFTPSISKSDFTRGLYHAKAMTARASLERNKHKIANVDLLEYANKIADTNPKVLLELGCGACFGTQLVVEHYRIFERLFTIDVDFVCTKVADGLFTYRGEIHKIDPIVGSFWFLPFRDDSINAVFTRGGLNESREIDRVLQEVSRVLKPGGRFVCLERDEPNLPLPLFDDLGFSIDDKRFMASIARIYAGADKFCEMMISNDMKVVSVDKRKHLTGYDRILFVFEK